MSRYTHEAPMDFEFQNGTGPLDARSPFAHISQNSPRFPPPNSSPRKQRGFDSPTKSTTSHAASPDKPLPQRPTGTAAFNSLYMTPRKSNSTDIDDSSAGETPRSPEQKDDSDATPDRTKFRSALGRIEAATAQPMAAERTSPVKEKPPVVRKDSWIVRAKNKFYSPGRGEIARVDHSAGMEKRVEKRRRREVDRKVARKRRHSVSESEADNERREPTSPRKASQPAVQEPKPHWMASLFTFLAQHPTIPHILSFYAQLAFNLFLLGGCAYLFYCFWAAVQGDVDKKSHEAMADILVEIAACSKHYAANECDQSTRLPAMVMVCENWAKCMKQDPHHVGRAKLSAHTFAEIFNSFVEPISYKAMAFTFVLVFGCFAVSNFAFGFFRDKAAAAGAAPYPPPQYYPPPTPQRNFSGPDGGFYAGTPWQQQQQQLPPQPPPVGFEPQPGDGYGQIDGRGSPVRRLVYN